MLCYILSIHSIHSPSAMELRPPGYVPPTLGTCALVCKIFDSDSLSLSDKKQEC